MRDVELLELIAQRTESLPHLVQRVDQISDHVETIETEVYALDARVGRVETRCDERTDRYTRQRADSGAVRVARITARQALIGALLGGLTLIVVTLLSLTASSCSGTAPLVTEPELGGQTYAEMRVSLDVGVLKAEIIGDATVDYPDEVTVCATVTVTALGMIRVRTLIAWDIWPVEGWQVCVEGLGLRQCWKGP